MGWEKSGSLLKSKRYGHTQPLFVPTVQDLKCIAYADDNQKDFFPSKDEKRAENIRLADLNLILF